MTVTTYQAVLVAADGDYVTDHEYDTPDEVLEAIGNQGSRWIFYPFGAVIETVPYPHKPSAIDRAVIVDGCLTNIDGIYVDGSEHIGRSVEAFRQHIRIATAELRKEK